ncbi:MAG: TrbI/VirB10 family protein [Verrucomicrobium sp.]|nr:TrbI/VirB10 family protein [Verrucomicrobium sp.]
MNVHRLEFLWKGQFGRFVLAGIAFGLVLGGVLYWKARHPRTDTVKNGPAQNAQASQSTVTTLDNGIPVFHAPAPRRAAATTQPHRSGNLPTSFLAFPISDRPQLGAAYAAYGRLIRCKLVITVDSNRIQTPILGTVLEDVYSVTHQLVVPAGAEVHGMAQLNSSEERIGSQNRWVLVWQEDDREVELPVSGLALDHDPSPDGRTWGITDGSAGLRGETIKTDNLAEIKELIAQFAAGAAQSLAQNEVQSALTANGTVIVQQNNGLTQALAQGAQNAASLYAQQIAEAVRRDGIFVRVPAGTDFYLYVTQTLDASQARAGATLAAGSNPALSDSAARPAAQPLTPSHP